MTSCEITQYNIIILVMHEFHITSWLTSVFTWQVPLRRLPRWQALFVYLFCLIKKLIFLLYFLIYFLLCYFQLIILIAFSRYCSARCHHCRPRPGGLSPMGCRCMHAISRRNPLSFPTSGMVVECTRHGTSICGRAYGY